MRIVTIGVYGFSENAFFNALQQAGVDVFIDLRRRRGVRGAEYAFANSRRLQERLAELGIEYIHRRDLSPTPEMIRRQDAADREIGIPRRQRASLSADFIAAYRDEIGARFDAMAFLESLPTGSETVALFCVEGAPGACHRSLLAEKLGEQAGLQIDHLLP